jgi:hypothetical protein
MSNDDKTGGARLFKNTAQQGKKVQEREGRRAIAAITAELIWGGGVRLRRQQKDWAFSVTIFPLR